MHAAETVPHMIKNILNNSTNRKSIPKAWCGIWIDKNGKQIKIDSTKHDFYSLTILDNVGNPFEIKSLGDRTKTTTGLVGRFTKDSYDNPVLQVEAGTDGIGPTLNLYFLALNENGQQRLARNSDKPSNIILKPDVGMGLYDDWEDDLGVPWAFPLDNYILTGYPEK